MSNEKQVQKQRRSGKPNDATLTIAVNADSKSAADNAGHPSTYRPGGERQQDEVCVMLSLPSVRAGLPTGSSAIFWRRAPRAIRHR